jgi:hypothetical protein
MERYRGAAPGDARSRQPRDTDDVHQPEQVKLDKDNEQVRYTHRNLCSLDAQAYVLSAGLTCFRACAQHMSWIFHRAQERAAQFKIQGVTYKLTMQASAPSLALAVLTPSLCRW